MREGCKSSGASEAWGSGSGERRRGGFSIGVGWRGEVGESDRWGPVDRETRERQPAREGMIRKGKRIFREDATDARARWASRDDFGLRGWRDRWAGWARGRTGNGVDRAESKEKNFRIKNWIFEFTKSLEICRRKFRWNFDMRIFPKFF
jgi:hypothetical protein